MPAAVRLRDDYSARDVRRLAARSKDANCSRRLLAIAAIYDGMNRGEAARIGGMDRQTLRDWVHRFNADGPMVWPTAGQTGRSRGSMRSRRPSLPQSSKLVLIVPRTGWCAGAGSI